MDSLIYAIADAQHVSTALRECNDFHGSREQRQVAFSISGGVAFKLLDGIQLDARPIHFYPRCST